MLLSGCEGINWIQMHFLDMFSKVFISCKLHITSRARNFFDSVMNLLSVCDKRVFHRKGGWTKIAKMSLSCSMHRLVSFQGSWNLELFWALFTRKPPLVRMCIFFVYP